MKRITVNLKGPTREFADSSTLEFELDENATVGDLRESLQNYLLKTEQNDKMGLLLSSVFSTDTSVLSDNAMLPSEQTITLLPPVSGG